MLKLMRMVVLEGFAQPSGSSGVSSRRCVTRFAPLNDSLYCVSTSQQMVMKAPTEMIPPELVTSDSSDGTRLKKCASRTPIPTSSTSPSQIWKLLEVLKPSLGIECIPRHALHEMCMQNHSPLRFAVNAG